MRKPSIKIIKPILKDEIEVNWLKRTVTASGANPGLILIVLLVLWFAGQFINKLIDTPSTATLQNAIVSISQEHKTLHEDHEALVKTQERIADAVEINTFLSTKNEKQKEKYKLDEPRALRRMQSD